jgi:hypothetical protein
MKKLILAGVLAMVGLGGCAGFYPMAGVKIIAEAPYEIVHQNVLDFQCSMKSQVLVGPCKDLKNFSDCAPNYPKIKQCRETEHWACIFEAVRIATAMDPTLGTCQGPIKQ